MKKFAALLLTLLCISPALSASALDGPVYQIFPSSFRDSDGDGCGDLQGIKDSLPYLRTLKAKGLWLTPISPSPSYHRYDVTDYTAVDPKLGTLNDFRELAEAMREENMALLVDLVINHTSNEHPWFQSACRSLSIPPCGMESCPHPELCRAHNPHVGYYAFENRSAGGEWHPVPNADGFSYLGVFGPHMPDLNLDNESVRDEIRRVTSFWLENGASGFRLDAVIHFFEQNTSKNAAFLKWLNDTIKAMRPDCYLIAEAWTDDATVQSLYETGLDSLFDFGLAGPSGQIVSAVRSKNGAAYAKAMEERYLHILNISPCAQNAPFLGNHDMGRISGVLRRNDALMKRAAALYLTLPGVPFVYYGEEVGMSGSGRDENKRLPMLWGGSGEGQCLPPENADQAQKQTLGVHEQDKDPSSLLNWYRGLLDARERLPEMAHGRLSALDTGITGVAAYTVRDGENACTVFHNLSGDEVTLDTQASYVLFFAGSPDGVPPKMAHGRLTLSPGSVCILK